MPDGKFWNKEKKKLLAILEPELTEAAGVSAREMLDAFEKEGITVSQSMRDQIETEAGISVGDHLSEVLDGIIKTSQDSFGSVDEAALESRADMVSVSEITAATAFGNTVACLVVGVESVIWRTMGDGDVCDDCLSNEDEGEVEIGSAFPTGDTEPPAHPNCRCYLEPVV